MVFKNTKQSAIKDNFLIHLRKIIIVNRFVLLAVLLLSNIGLFASNEVGPEGAKLIWFLLIPVFVVLFFMLFKKKGTNPKTVSKPLFQRKRVKIELKKNKNYYPDNLSLTVKNSGNSDIDLDKPLLIFDNFWLNRKFKLKGVGNYSFYPLYLEKGKTHTLKIDLDRFYEHDKKLKKFPKAKVKLFDVNGKHLGSKSVYLRKTLVKF